MSTYSDTTFTPAVAFPPGEFLRDELEAREWTQEDLADVLGVSVRLVNEVIKGKRSVTVETAQRLGDAFGTGAQFWLNLESSYQLWRAKQSDSSVAKRARLYAKAPVRAMIKRGWLPETKDLAELERHVLAFTEQPSLDEEFVFPHAARRTEPCGPMKPEQFAWLCRARQLARLVRVTRQWKEGRVEDLVRELQRLILGPPALREVPRVLADFGIRFVALERLPNMKMAGATFWLSKTEPVIVLSFTHDRIDNALHTLLHEIDHTEHGESMIDEEVLRQDETPEIEKRADRFAVESLVPQKKLEDFCNRVAPLFYEVKVIGFADLLQIHPGIVVGQLHHRGPSRSGLAYTHLRKFLVPVRKYMTELAMTEGWGRTVPVFTDEE
jgi:HTH-type transcriptional regulator/antitoxin HigA